MVLSENSDADTLIEPAGFSAGSITYNTYTTMRIRKMQPKDVLAALEHETDHGGATQKDGRYYPVSRRSEHLLRQLEILGSTQYLPLKVGPVLPTAQRSVEPPRNTSHEQHRFPRQRQHNDTRMTLGDSDDERRRKLHGLPQSPSNRPARPQNQGHKKHGFHKAGPNNGPKPDQRRGQPAGPNNGPRPQHNQRFTKRPHTNTAATVA